MSLSLVLRHSARAHCLLSDRTDQTGSAGWDTRSSIEWVRAVARGAAWDGLLIELASSVKDRRPCRRGL